jgi:hypothetical protein
VDVFGRPFQLSERRYGMPRFGGEFMVNFEQDGLIALDYQGSVVHAGESFTGAVPLQPQYQ